NGDPRHPLVLGPHDQVRGPRAAAAAGRAADLLLHGARAGPRPRHAAARPGTALCPDVRLPRTRAGRAPERLEMTSARARSNTAALAAEDAQANSRAPLYRTHRAVIRCERVG